MSYSILFTWMMGHTMNLISNTHYSCEMRKYNTNIFEEYSIITLFEIRKTYKMEKDTVGRVWLGIFATPNIKPLLTKYAIIVKTCERRVKLKLSKIFKNKKNVNIWILGMKIKLWLNSRDVKYISIC